MTQAGWPGR